MILAVLFGAHQFVLHVIPHYRLGGPELEEFTGVFDGAVRTRRWERYFYIYVPDRGRIRLDADNALVRDKIRRLTGKETLKVQAVKTLDFSGYFIYRPYMVMVDKKVLFDRNPTEIIQADANSRRNILIWLFGSMIIMFAVLLRIPKNFAIYK